MSSRASWQLAQEGSSAGTPQPSDEAEVALAPMTAVAMAERASKMFVVSAAGPQRSGLPPAARKVNKELCLLAFNAANDLCNEHGKALSAAFGNFDRVVALGWLIGDALGMPPVDRGGGGGGGASDWARHGLHGVGIGRREGQHMEAGGLRVS